jgi:putative inner membrane exporter YdcZ
MFTPGSTPPVSARAVPNTRPVCAKAGAAETTRKKGEDNGTLGVRRSTAPEGFKHGGAGLVTALTVFGQLTMAVLVDHFAWLGAHHTPLNRWRMSGIALLSIGAVLIQRK